MHSVTDGQTDSRTTLSCQQQPIILRAGPNHRLIYGIFGLHSSYTEGLANEVPQWGQGAKPG